MADETGELERQAKIEAVKGALQKVDTKQQALSMAEKAEKLDSAKESVNKAVELVPDVLRVMGVSEGAVDRAKNVFTEGSWYGEGSSDREGIVKRVSRVEELMASVVTEIGSDNKTSQVQEKMNTHGLIARALIYEARDVIGEDVIDKFGDGEKKALAISARVLELADDKGGFSGMSDIEASALASFVAGASSEDDSALYKAMESEVIELRMPEARSREVVDTLRDETHPMAETGKVEESGVKNQVEAEPVDLSGLEQGEERFRQAEVHAEQVQSTANRLTGKDNKDDEDDDNNRAEVARRSRKQLSGVRLGGLSGRVEQGVSAQQQVEGEKPDTATSETAKSPVVEESGGKVLSLQESKKLLVDAGFTQTMKNMSPDQIVEAAKKLVEDRAQLAERTKEEERGRKAQVATWGLLGAEGRLREKAEAARQASGETGDVARKEEGSNLQPIEEIQQLSDKELAQRRAERPQREEVGGLLSRLRVEQDEAMQKMTKIAEDQAGTSEVPGAPLIDDEGKNKQPQRPSQLIQPQPPVSG